jgi:hypothetical protein
MPGFNVSDRFFMWPIVLSDIVYMQSKVILQIVLCFLRLSTISAVSNAWNGQYIGNSHRLLLNNINHMLRDMPYSNTVTILQSSGTGKSRMVHEQSNLVFTLPFNLRPHIEGKGHSLPPMRR